MSIAVARLCRDVAAVQTVANVRNVDGSNGNQPNFIFSPSNPAGTNSPAESQGFQLVVQGNSGQAVSATAQIVASNDGIHWSNLVTVTAASATTVSSGIAANSNAPYLYYGAYITAITGTGALASVTMCA